MHRLPLAVLQTNPSCEWDKEVEDPILDALLHLPPLFQHIKKRDYHSIMTCAYSGLILSLAAIIYVDDTDLLFRSKKHHSHEEFFSFIQDALNFWGMLVLATDGVLKQKKSRVAVALFKFSDGRARLLQPRAFPKL